MPDVDVADALIPTKEKLESIIARLEKIKSSGSVRYGKKRPRVVAHAPQ